MYGQANVAPEVLAPTVPQPATVGASISGNGYSPSSNGHTTATVEQVSTNGRKFISPIARHIAAEHQIDLATITGSGPNGRIIRDDVEAYLERLKVLLNEKGIPYEQGFEGELTGKWKLGTVHFT